jgi:hypothetical protein
VKVMKVTSKMKLSPGILLDVVIDQLRLPDDSPKTRMNRKIFLFLHFNSHVHQFGFSVLQEDNMSASLMRTHYGSRRG